MCRILPGHLGLTGTGIEIDAVDVRLRRQGAEGACRRGVAVVVLHDDRVVHRDQRVLGITHALREVGEDLLLRDQGARRTIVDVDVHVVVGIVRDGDELVAGEIVEAGRGGARALLNLPGLRSSSRGRKASARPPRMPPLGMAWKQ